MDARQFDRISRIMGSVANRRRLLTRTATLLGVAATARPTAAKKNKKDKNDKKVCKQQFKQCQQNAKEICRVSWPDDKNNCNKSLKKCCKKDKKCNFDAAAKCQARSKYL